MIRLAKGGTMLFALCGHIESYLLGTIRSTIYTISLEKAFKTTIEMDMELQEHKAEDLYG